MGTTLRQIRIGPELLPPGGWGNAGDSSNDTCRGVIETSTMLPCNEFLQPIDQSPAPGGTLST